MFYSYAAQNLKGGGHRVRPVVTIGPSIKISAEGGAEDNPRTLSK